jgi:uncharacterized sulfatase
MNLPRLARSLRRGILWSAGLAVLTVLPASVPAAPAVPRPNVLCVVTDDLSAWALGCYGNRDSRTPHLDRLAREGGRFLNSFVVTPVCSPSRASFLTGRHGTQVGITDWINPQEAKAGLGLPVGSSTWPRILQQAGYATGLAGKWHLGEQPQFHPTRFGFDSFMGGLGGAYGARNPQLEVGGQVRTVEGFSADVVTDAALGFLGTNASRPFLLMVHYREPHAPYAPVAEEDNAPFRDLDPAIPDFPGLNAAQVKNWTRQYYAALHAVDRSVGRLLDRLETLKVADRTVVIFTSDNGYMIGHHGMHMKGNGHLITAEGNGRGRQRPNLFEESLRVPLILRWPGVVRGGTEYRETVCNLDFWATVPSMLGLKSPGDWRQEGRDFSPLLRGEPYTPRRELFGQYDLHHGGRAALRMVRTEDWKLVRDYRPNGRNELYDLRHDPGERRNVYGEAAVREVQADLQGRLSAWMRGIGDAPPEPKP